MSRLAEQLLALTLGPAAAALATAGSTGDQPAGDNSYALSTEQYG